MNTDTMTEHRVKQLDVTCCPILELRQYALYPGKRDALIELFEREFIETQAAAGIHVIGQFKDLDEPDSFVWMRGFPDMPRRKRALQAFYEGPAWKRHREAANATMIDSGNVLLLRPARAASGFRAYGSGGIAQTRRGMSQGVLAATIYYIDEPPERFTEFFENTLQPACAAAGANCLAYFVTEDSPNTYPALPVREGEQVFVWFARFDSPLAHARYEEALQTRCPGLLTRLAQRLRGRPDRLRLAPTARSPLQV